MIYNKLFNKKTPCFSRSSSLIQKGFGDIENNYFNDNYKSIISIINALSDEIEKRKLPVSTVQWYTLIA